MWRATLNAILLLAVVATAALFAGSRTDPTVPNVEFFPNMAHSPRYNAYEPNPVFGDGKTMQSPPPGAIARGYMPTHYAATPEDAKRAGEELTSPLANDPAAAEPGAKLFAIYCQACHGPGGLGNGPVALRGFPPPPSLLADHARGLKDGQIFHIITFGQVNMPPHAAQIPRENRWKLVSFMRKLQAAAPPAPTAPAPQEAKK